jgi:hypothetical protein
MEADLNERNGGSKGLKGKADEPLSRIQADKRLSREWKTLAAMIGCYCLDIHRPTAGLCSECEELLNYATVRLERCRFGSEKPVCAQCPVHCYQRSQRDRIKVVMRYAGPRMIWRHPILSMGHWLDGFHTAPRLP